MSESTVESRPTRSDIYNFQLPGDELSAKLGKGIPKGSIVVIEGEEGSGRSVLCQRFLFGMLTNGHTGTYISTEMTLKDFIDQMYSLNYKIEKQLISGSLQYFPVYPLIGNTIARTNFLDKLISSSHLYSKDLLFIDSLTTLARDGLDNNSCIRLIAFLKKQTKDDKTIVLTIEEGNKSVEQLRLAADIYICLKMKPTSRG